MNEETLTALARTYYSKVDAGDVDGLLDLFTADAVYRRPGYEPMRGRQSLNSFYRGERVIAEGRHEVLSMTAESPRVAVTGTFSGVLKDGSRVRLAFADFFTAGADGLFTHRETYFYAPLV
ncbi:MULTISPECIES: nuclear transport factor 2 family protein [Streptomyces]|uniref:Nuclear transport factor 2 family protein n=1 Tax=Streptomyces doudnae TaxID=3075536 RepID=A0ABD5F1K5_9ACTN|nr:MULTISPECIES: nuclear transport factor 2 family protein [unclassified Streptomyces]MDT0440129.1 nuclear transport factor 2 family protein [Streptomyces sp. DSM 41981]SCE53539.1 Ketosteroid isomerase-related protein [Streptomyces sp. SolWspMP-5a-2]